MEKKVKPAPAAAVVHPNAAGLDIGAREIWACVPAGRDEATVKPFATFTPDLRSLADWLISCGVDTVAMESTGIYWIPIFEILEARGLNVYLVNARHIKNVPGRKSDVQDCQWIQKLHSLGLLTASFRPDGEMVALRTYLRHRAQLMQHRAPHISHMQKALQQMNLQLPHVLSDITGETGIRILRAIVAGERDPIQLAQFRDPRCQSSQETIAKALTGDWKTEHVFALTQSLELYDFYSQQIAACDTQIQQQYAVMKPRWEVVEDAAAPMVEPKRAKMPRRNEPPAETRQVLLHLTGIDLAAVEGIGPSLAQTILSEIGTDMTKWPTVKHFASWLGLAPHNDISGGRVLRSRTLSTNNRAGQAFRQAATSLARSASTLGAYYRRKRAQGGPQFAQVATAHKLARIVYHLLRYRVSYVEMSATVFDQKQRERDIANLRKRAEHLGFTLALPQTSDP